MFLWCDSILFVSLFVFFFFFKQKTAYEMRISDWSSDVCSSDLPEEQDHRRGDAKGDHVGKRIEFGTEFTLRTEQPRDPPVHPVEHPGDDDHRYRRRPVDRKSTRLNSSH